MSERKPPTVCLAGTVPTRARLAHHAGPRPPRPVLAYFLAVLQGADVGPPRDLAKSVTVEWGGATGGNAIPPGRKAGKGPD